MAAVQLRHDFGSIISDGEILSHTFRFRNSSGRVLKVVETFVAKPCCSGFGEIASTVSPYGFLDIPIFMKTLGYEGPVEASFVVRTDAPGLDRLSLVARANLIEEFAIQPVGDEASAFVGQDSEFFYRLITRRPLGRNRLPLKLSISPPFHAGLLGDETEHEYSAGVIEWSRDLSVRLPAREKPGPISTSIRLEWDEGRVSTIPLSLMVRANLETSPEAVMITSAERNAERVIIVRSHNRPFVVRMVEGTAVSRYTIKPDESGSKHQVVISIRFDLGGLPNGERVSIRIVTDDPGSPVLTVPVVVVDESRNLK